MRKKKEINGTHIICVGVIDELMKSNEKNVDLEYILLKMNATEIARFFSLYKSVSRTIWNIEMFVLSLLFAGLNNKKGVDCEQWNSCREMYALHSALGI